MPDNPYIREITITILEVVPQKDQLPWCSAYKLDGYACGLRGKYIQNGKPVCGQHLGKPRTIFYLDENGRGHREG